MGVNRISMLASIALELEIRNRSEELAASLRDHPTSWIAVEPPPAHIENRIAENLALHERLRAELAQAIARRGTEKK